MAGLIIYAFMCFMVTFGGSYIAINDELGGLSEAQINQIVYELYQGNIEK